MSLRKTTILAYKFYKIFEAFQELETRYVVTELAIFEVKYLYSRWRPIELNSRAIT